MDHVDSDYFIYSLVKTQIAMPTQIAGLFKHDLSHEPVKPGGMKHNYLINLSTWTKKPLIAKTASL